jgi:hypothetical protein
MVALMFLLAVPGPILAKWTIVVEFEPASGTVGEPAGLAAVVSIPSHDVPGMEVPSLRDIEPVVFRLESLESRQVIEAPGVPDGRREGRYVAEVTMPEPGEWRIQLFVTLGGRKTSHLDFPEQVPALVTVAASSGGAPPFAGASLALAAAVVLVIGYRRLGRHRRSHAGWMPS